MKHPYIPTLKFIESYWKQITWSFPKDKNIVVGLPNKFVSPNAHIFKNDQFYWDSYFTILGLLPSGRASLAKGMVDNFVYLFDRFHIIPSRNRFYNVGISQPPFLTSMGKEVFAITGDKKWLKKVADTAALELKDYWMYDGTGERAEYHLAYQGLSRYCDHFIVHFTAEHESGWDMTSRFDERCLDYLPVDLNTLLYKYEIDLAEIYSGLGKTALAKKFKLQAAKRKATMMRLMWNVRANYFFDYDWNHKQQSNFWSLAGMYPMWAGMVTAAQAEKMVKSLRKFETKFGLVNTLNKDLSKDYKQWDFPNGWPNQQYIVIKALLNYGYEADAKRLAKKWLDLVAAQYKKTGKVWEKYDVVSGGTGKAGHYQTQYGFGWTNATFSRLVFELWPEAWNASRQK